VDLHADGEIQEFVAHSWYDYAGGTDAGLHPYKGETKLDYDGRGGPEPPYTAARRRRRLLLAQVAALERSSSVEVGPLARMLLLYASGARPRRRPRSWSTTP
jgi:hydrogenase large subunit